MSEGTDSGNGHNHSHREIWGIAEREGREKGFWTRIGVAFENKDGSWFLKFDYVPTRPDIKLQMREPREWEPRDGPPGAAERR